jgi:molybdopterin/thiamine biosynthesis adenylyltransferase
MDDRYFRQTLLNQIGPEGQKRLSRSSVVVVGAGGLGSPALTYLVAAGVGRVGLIDSDTVSLSNLNRQFLHGDSDIGRAKAVSATEKLRALNGDIEIIACKEKLSDENAETLFAGYDLVLGAVDSFDTRFVINRAAVALGLPYIDGGVNGFCGCVMFSHPPKTPCLNCVFPNRDKKNNPIGVLGTTAGVIGTLEANLALLWLLNLKNPIENKLLMYDGFRMSIDLIKIKRDKNCSVCGGGAI